MKLGLEVWIQDIINEPFVILRGSLTENRALVSWRSAHFVWWRNKEAPFEKKIFILTAILLYPNILVNFLFLFNFRTLSLSLSLSLCLLECRLETMGAKLDTDVSEGLNCILGIRWLDFKCPSHNNNNKMAIMWG